MKFPDLQYVYTVVQLPDVQFVSISSQRNFPHFSMQMIHCTHCDGQLQTWGMQMDGKHTSTSFPVLCKLHQTHRSITYKCYVEPK